MENSLDEIVSIKLDRKKIGQYKKKINKMKKNVTKKVTKVATAVKDTFARGNVPAKPVSEAAEYSILTNLQELKRSWQRDMDANPDPNRKPDNVDKIIADMLAKHKAKIAGKNSGAGVEKSAEETNEEALLELSKDALMKYRDKAYDQLSDPSNPNKKLTKRFKGFRAADNRIKSKLTEEELLELSGKVLKSFVDKTNANAKDGKIPTKKLWKKTQAVKTASDKLRDK